ncbi:MAG: hypothetical protein LBR33_02555 [Propionibacteriaceae bacterium]|jgi:hypothetical protein|nr:hypothetical protein [Propionibacteriaceae bacterium]
MSRAYEDPAEERPRRGGTVVGVVVGLAVGLALVAVVVWWFILRPHLEESESGPNAVAWDYLNALAKGDSAAALGLAAAPPTDATYLTDAVLRANPLIDGIVVEETGQDGDQAYALVTYRVGGQSVSTKLNLVRQAGQWLVNYAYGGVTLPAASADIGLSLDGIPLDGKTRAELFPGTYHLEVAESYLTLSQTDFSIAAPGQIVTLDNLAVALSDGVQETLRQAAAAQLAACVATTDFKPADEACGFGLRAADGTTSDEFAWSVTGGSLDGVTFALSAGDPKRAEAQIEVTLHGEGLGNDGGMYQGDQTLTQVSADLTDPAQPVITFAR